MEIRVARPEDLEALLPLWHEMVAAHASLEDLYTPRADAGDIALQHFRRVCAAEDRLLLICRGESVCGFLSASIRPAAPVFDASPVGVINELAVAAPYRRRGVGRRLYEEARAWLAGRGIGRVEVRTLTGNEASNAFWRKLGLQMYAAEYKGGTSGG